MSVSVKRKPVYCGACSMNITNAVRIRCAQLQPAPTPKAVNGGSTTSDQQAITSIEDTSTRKHEPIDSLPRAAAASKGLVPTCEEFDICGSCFCEGKEVGRHKRWHDYRVVVRTEVNAAPTYADPRDFPDSTRLSNIYQ